VLIHAAVWILLFSLPFLLNPSHDDESRRPQRNGPQNMLAYIIGNCLWVTLFYLNAYVLVPRFLDKKKFLGYLAAITVVFGFYIFLGWVNFILLRNEPFNIRIHIFLSFFIYLFMIATSTAYKMIGDRIKADRIAKEKETEGLKTELSFLRSQVSPHFMFNVLNNMVSLARKQSDQLEPSLIKLSSLMRYMLYETDEEKVSLEREMDYLQSYIDLQQQRFGKKVKLKVNLREADKQYQIEPMLLIPFVENAFKHGTGMVENAEIDIELKAEKDILQFSVRNMYNPASKEIKDKTSGIGLTNVKRRLNLLYSNRQTLMITKENNRFIVDLQIHLN